MTNSCFRRSYREEAQRKGRCLLRQAGQRSRPNRSHSPTAVSGDSESRKPNGKAIVSSAKPVKRVGQTGFSLATAVSGDPESMKPNGKAVVSSTDEMLFFKDVKFRPQVGELRFRQIHFWEARNAHTKVLIGLEMILIDGHGTVIQGFIPPSRIDTYLPHMIAGSIYRLHNFYGSKRKPLYRVAEPDVTIAFSWNYVLSVFENSTVLFPEDRFRFYGYEEFEAACDLRGDLYDYVGHIKLVNEQPLSDSLVLDEVEIASSKRILLYIWDKAATDFCDKFKKLGKPPTVNLVTTVNPKWKGVFKHNLGAQSIATLGDRMAEENDGEPVDDLALMKRAYTNKKTGQIDDGLVREVVTLVQTQVQDEVSQLQTEDDDSTASTNLSRVRINEIVESSVPKKKGRLVGLGRRSRSVPPFSAPPPFVDPEVLTAQLKDKDDRISLLETQMAAQQAGYGAQKRLNQQMMEMMKRMYPNEVFPNVQDP
ncbi:hypothetical protein DY000_02044878 [Brassica cretica]|uniref:Uncharacterized protein n=1 Tax=Brassica cretica TaxID=69181 RepID=A0ABQ7ERB1_BRACR|nr:hypothetical protein DY000_02044878 [Brassica cretica]